MKEFDLKKAPKPANTENKFSYRKQGKKGGKKDTLVASIKPELDDKLERDAYKRNLNKSEMLEMILAAYYAGKDFEPIPAKNTDI